MGRCPTPKDTFDLDFRNETTWCLQEIGRDDAKAMLELGQDKIHKSLEEWWGSMELKEEHTFFENYLSTFIN